MLHAFNHNGCGVTLRRNSDLLVMSTSHIGRPQYGAGFLIGFNIGCRVEDSGFRA